MKDSEQKLDHFSENLAFPEIHVNSQKPEEDDTELHGKGDIVYDDLAVPEIKVKKTKGKK